MQSRRKPSLYVYKKEGTLRPELAAIAVPATIGGRNMTGDDFALTSPGNDERPNENLLHLEATQLRAGGE